jgi:hypothetical protein
MQEDVTHAGIAHGRAIADRVAFGRLDLDYVGAEIAEDLCGVRAEYDGGEIEDAHARERAGTPCLE